LAEIKIQFPDWKVILDTTQFSYTFFEKYGFKTMKITKNSYGEGMHRYDMILEGSKS
jgi:ribosomal-protein-alanine N-acetyltransferase